MFTSRHPRQRRAGMQPTYSPSPPPRRPSRQFPARVHATADFTEADEDEDEDEDDDFGQGLNNGNGADQDTNDDDEAVDDIRDAEQHGPGGLPVLPLFSASHLGILSLQLRTSVWQFLD